MATGKKTHNVQSQVWGESSASRGRQSNWGSDPSADAKTKLQEADTPKW